MKKKPESAAERLARMVQAGFAEMHRVMNTRFDGVDSRLDKVENRLDKVEDRLDGIEDHVENIYIRLTAIERPI